MQAAVLSDSPAYRAGISALLQEESEIFIQIVDTSDTRLDDDLVYILFFDELARFSDQISGKKVVVIIPPNIKSEWFLTEHENSWGVLPYDADAADLIAVVAAVNRGMVVIPVNEISRLVDKKKNGETPISDKLAENLTDREREILQLLGLGQPNKQIALGLGISENTVKFHISAIFSKLGVNNRTEALRAGNKYGLISM
jgi:DNA-binding NarL/FixJ family response regulator